MPKQTSQSNIEALAGFTSRGVLYLITTVLALTSPVVIRAEGKPLAKPTAKKAPAKKVAAKPDDAPTPKQESEPTSTGGIVSEAKAILKDAPVVAPSATIAPDDLVEFQNQPGSVKKLIEACLELARRNLTYTFGSADPAKGGMDCSGFVYFTLRQHGFTQVPRDSSGQYSWVRRARGFRAVISRKADSFEMDELLPGDLLFWTGTYTNDHDPPISHVMVYIGTEKSTGARVMLGSSNGRTYRGLSRNGVSVFDFTMPHEAKAGGAQSTFVGYGRIPGLRE